MNKPAVLLLFGGQSSEHDVSVASARNVAAAIDRAKYDLTLGYIDRAGKWWLLESIKDEISIADCSQIIPLLGEGLFMTMPDRNAIKPDVVFPVLHGKYGEDGTLQGLLEMVGVPYVGCGVEASALCMDKVRTKILLADKGIQVAPGIAFNDLDECEQELALNGNRDKADFDAMIGPGPWFVKPSRAGSSVGVTKVYEFSKLAEAARVAFSHDSDILIEQAISDMHEVEVAVLGNKNNIQVSQPGEIVPGEDFYSYEDKYSASSSSHANFELPEKVRVLKDVIRQLAADIYTTLGCSGLSRIDFFVTDNMEIYLNEVNTMPGFTNISMYPKLWQREGLSYSQLIDRLLTDAINDTIE